MFSYPWDGSDECKSFAAIGQLNKTLSDRTVTLLKESKRAEVGSCKYNLTLINRCYPINGEVKMKLEPTYQKEKCTVSWHADSTLEHYSSIAVLRLEYTGVSPSSLSGLISLAAASAVLGGNFRKKWAFSAVFCLIPVEHGLFYPFWTRLGRNTVMRFKFHARHTSVHSL